MEIFEVIKELIEKDTYAIALSVVSVIVSISGLRLARKTKTRRVKDVVLDLEIKVAKMKLEALKLPEEERLEAQAKLEGIEEVIKDFYASEAVDKSESRSSQKQGGFISQEFMLYAVPAIIALSFTFALIYLLIANQATPDYQTPEILKTGLTTIIGYYFGVIAVKDKSAAKNESTSIENLQKQVEALTASNESSQQDASGAGNSA